MPKILASNLPSAASRAGAADLSSQLLSTSNKASRKERAGGGAFDDLLSGARRREVASQPKPDESQRATSSRSKPAKESRGVDEESDERASDDVNDAHESKATESKRSAEKARKRSNESKGQSVDSTDDASAAEANDADSADASKVNATDDAPTAEDPDDESTVVAADDKAKHAKDDQPADGELDPTQLAVLLAQSTAADPNEVTDQSASGESTGGDSSAADPTGELAAQLAHTGNRVARVPAHSTAKSPAAAAPDATGADAGVAKLGQAPATKPQADVAVTAASNAANSVESLDGGDAKSADATSSTPASHAAAPDPSTGAAHALEAALDQQAAAQQAHAKPAATPAAQPQQQNVAPEVRFADDNHDNIVSGVRGQLMPNGGTMRMRLDPPELGPLAVTVRLRNGVMEASFETSSDEAAKLLSHSLGSLKTSLESQGVNVERLHVQQAPKSEQTSSQGDERDGGQQQGQQRDLQQEQQARQEHQRREMIRRMWRKLRGVDDPLDMVA